MERFVVEEVDLGKNTHIEASAGTGKTWTLAKIVVRLVTEARWRVFLPEILVVTFTHKAAREMRERIRRFLSLEACCPKRSPEERDRLREAIDLFDCAAIHTIHGFCHEVLRRYPLETNTLFAPTIDDGGHLQREVRGYLRALSTRDLSSRERRLSRAFAPPGKSLEEQVRLLVTLLKEGPSLVEALVPIDAEPFFQKAEAFDRGEGELRRLLVTLTTFEGGEAALEVLQKEAGVRYRRTTRENVVHFWRSLGEKDLSFDLFHDLFFEQRDLIERFSPAVLEERGSRGSEALTTTPLGRALISFFDEFSFVRDPDDPSRSLYRETLRALFLTKALGELMHIGQRRKEALRTLDFPDLIERVHRALVPKETRNPTLLAHLRARYKVVLLDEFQDTDEKQWEIFKTLFGRDTAHTYFLIGDPKQAIYRFRRADLGVCLRAFKEADAHYCLTTNYRSVAPLVEGTNMMFSCLFAAQQGEKTPLLFEHASSSSHVVPRRGKGGLVFLSIQEEGRSLSGWRFVSAVAERFVEKIQELLNGGEGILPSDIAILVDTQRECDLYRRYLEKRGIFAVVPREESIFASQEAEVMLLLMTFLSPPADARPWKALLLSFLFAFTAEEVALLETIGGEHLISEKIEKWRDDGNRGALPKLIREIDALRIALASVLREKGYLDSRREAYLRLSWEDRSLGDSGGERRWTNFWHLVEILHREQWEKGLDLREVRKLLIRLKRGEEEDEESAVRLCQERTALQVMTIHASKGLEFPIVFFAGALLSKENRMKQSRYYFCSEGTKRQVDFRRRESLLREERREGWEEQKRLTYVACTRAIERLYLPLPKRTTPVALTSLYETFAGEASHRGKGGGDWMLPPSHQRIWETRQEGEAVAEEIYRTAAKRILALGRGFTLERREGAAPVTGRSTTSSPPSLYSARKVVESLGTSARCDTYVSFTSLAQAAHVRASPEKKSLQEEETARGGLFGRFMHAVLEKIDYRKIGETPGQGSFSSLMEREARVLFGEGWFEENRSDIEPLLTAALCTEITPGVRLAQIKRENRLHEVPFFLKIATNHLLTFEGERYFFRKGFLKGFVDLLFHHRGKIYLVDWKTTTLPSYDALSLKGAMRDHRYSLQLRIYALVLYRYLRSFSLETSRCEEAFGGCFYLFLRGMGQGREGIYFTRPTESELITFSREIGSPCG